MKSTAQFSVWARKHALLLVASVVAVAVVAVLSVVLLVKPGSSTASAPPTSTPKPTATPAPTDPATVSLAATFNGWTVEGEDDTASTVSADAGDSHDGSVVLRLDSTSPVDGASHKALSQTIEVTPATEYSFSAWTRSSVENAAGSAGAVSLGEAETDRVDIPHSTKWSEVKTTVMTAADQNSLTLRVATSGPTIGTRIDNLTLSSAESTTNLVHNGSFEQFAAATNLIANKSLIMSAGAAKIGFALPATSVAWTIADQTEKTIESGDTDTPSGLGVIPLSELPQGYYRISLTSNDDPAVALQTSFAVLDATAAGEETSDARFGVGTHLNKPAYAGSEIPAAQLGIKNARMDMVWHKAEKVPGEYAFPADIDARFQSFEAAGLTMLPISVYTNKLYDGGKAPSSPEGIDAFSKYTREVATHLGSPAVEVFNEFNNPPMNKGACGLTAECYLPLLKSSAEKVRATSPTTKIIGPSIAHKDDAWLTALYQAGGLEYLDAITFHPYDSAPENGPEFLIESLQQAVDRIKEYNDGQSKPIWITELGVSTAGVTEQDQANYLVRAEAISLANGVEKFYWYDLVNDESDPTHHEGNFGLLRQTSETVPVFAPKPSGVAQAVLARMIAGKLDATRDGLNDSAYSYAYTDGDSTTRVAWSTVPTTVTFAAKKPVTMTSQYGKETVLKPVKGLITVKLTDEAIYLDGKLTSATIAD
jgi:polysaccharide biosynthesis protein PslG